VLSRPGRSKGQQLLDSKVICTKFLKSEQRKGSLGMRYKICSLSIISQFSVPRRRGKAGVKSTTIVKVHCNRLLQEVIHEDCQTHFAGMERNRSRSLVLIEELGENLLGILHYRRPV